MPDVALVEHDDPHAHPERAALAVEVVVTQYSEAQRKVGVYAAAGVEQYWIIDVPRSEVLVHSQPEGDAHLVARRATGDDMLGPPFGIAPLSVSELFARAGLIT